MKPIPALAFGAALACAAGAASAQDHADIDRTRIIGNRELPKVLYIVPWKKPLPGDLSGRPLVSVLDEALAPVDRDVFRRQIRYDAQARAYVTAAAAPVANTAPAPDAAAPTPDRPAVAAAATAAAAAAPPK